MMSVDRIQFFENWRQAKIGGGGGKRERLSIEVDGDDDDDDDDYDGVVDVCVRVFVSSCVVNNYLFDIS